MTANADESIEAAAAAFEVDDNKRVIALLGPIPPKLLTDEARTMLEKSQLVIEQSETSKSGLRKALEEKDYAAAGQHLDILLEQQPANAKYQKLAHQVAQKLIEKAARRVQQNRYRSAVELLQSVPSIAVGDESKTLSEKAEEYLWLSDQFAGEPFATPALGRLAKRWHEQAPSDRKAKEALSLIAKRFKTKPEDPRITFTLRAAQEHTVGSAAILESWPFRKPFVEPIIRNSRRHQRNSASLWDWLYRAWVRSRSRISSISPNKGFSDFSVERSNSDVGDSMPGPMEFTPSSWKRVRRTEREVVKISDCFFHRFEEVGVQVKGNKVDHDWVRSAVEQFLSDRDVAEIPIWISMRGRELVTRFVQLPPVTDKQAQLLFEREIKDGFHSRLRSAMSIWSNDWQAFRRTKITRSDDPHLSPPPRRRTSTILSVSSRMQVSKSAVCRPHPSHC